jgi:hypothetical protein
MQNSLPVIASAAKQSIYPLCRAMDCFAPLEMTKRKKAGIAPGLQVVASLLSTKFHFASARLGGVAGHDFTRVS